MNLQRSMSAVLAVCAALALCSGCATHQVSYKGPIFTLSNGPEPSRDTVPVPVHIVVNGQVENAPASSTDLTSAIVMGLHGSRSFARVSDAHTPVDSDLRRLDLPVTLAVDLTCSITAGDVALWALIFPMFMPLHDVVADGSIEATLLDKGEVLQSYASRERTVGRRNAVGIAYVRNEMASTPRWSQDVIDSLVSRLIQQIIEDKATYEPYRKAEEHP